MKFVNAKGADVPLGLNPCLSQIDFSKLTFETLDFNTPFPMEYAYNVWKSHPLQGEELRDMFWKFMRIHFRKFYRSIDSYECLFSQFYFEREFMQRFERLEHSKTILSFYLFMWYSPEIIDALSNDDLNTIVVVDGFLDDFECSSKNCVLDLEKFKPIEYDDDWDFYRLEDAFRHLLTLIVSSHVMNVPYNWKHIDRTMYHIVMPHIRAQRENCQREYLCNEVLEEIFKKDDVEALVHQLEYVNDNHNLVIGVNKSFQIQFHYSDLLQRLSRLTPLNLAIIYKAKDIMKYLIMNDAKLSLKDLIISVFLNDYESIHFCVDNWDGIGGTIHRWIADESKALTASHIATLTIDAIMYNRPEIYDWLNIQEEDPRKRIYKFKDLLRQFQIRLDFPADES
jgi:hypothetical protein